MSTVTFQVNPKHISHFISEKSKGGVCIEVTHTETQETGWMFIGHTSNWRQRKEMLKGKVRWVASCFLKDNHYSPFEGGNSNKMVSTCLKGNKLEVTINNSSTSITNNQSLPSVEDWTVVEEELPRLNWYSYSTTNREYSCLFRPEWGGVRYFIRIDNVIYEVSREIYDGR